MPSSKILRSAGGVGNIAKYTSPLKLFDYMASGKLIIASNLNVFKEILKGLMVENYNPKLHIVIKNINNLRKFNF